MVYQWMVYDRICFVFLVESFTALDFTFKVFERLLLLMSVFACNMDML